MKVNYNNYLSKLSWGWLATLFHSLYWTLIIYTNNQTNKNYVFSKDDLDNDLIDNNVSQRQPNEILQLRMLHYLFMCFGCLIFTLTFLCLNHFCKDKTFSIFGYKISNKSMNRGLGSSSDDKFLMNNLRSSNGTSQSREQNMYSGYTTSYQQHSSSAEERKYMQQQLMQFNRQMSRSHNYDEVASDRHEEELKQQIHFDDVQNTLLQKNDLRGQKSNKVTHVDLQQFNPFKSESRLNESSVSSLVSSNQLRNQQQQQSTSQDHNLNNQSSQQNRRSKLKIVNSNKIDNKELKKGLLEGYNQHQQELNLLQQQLQQQSQQHNQRNNNIDLNNESSSIEVNPSQLSSSDINGNKNMLINGQDDKYIRDENQRSTVNFNGDFMYSRDQKNLQIHGTFSFFFVLHNYKLYLLFLVSSVLSVLSQLKLAESIDKSLLYNLPQKDSTFSEDMLCFLYANSYSLILMFFALFHHFLIYPDTDQGRAQQKDESLTAGIYMMLLTLICWVGLNLIIQEDQTSGNINQIALAWTLMGIRMFVTRVYFDVMSRNERPSCFVINMIQIWLEFAVFVIYLMIYKPDALFQSGNHFIYSFTDLVEQSLISALYILSLISFNTALLRQSLYNLINQFNQSTVFIILIMVIQTQIMSFRFLIVALLGGVAYLFLKYCGSFCLRYFKSFFSQSKQKGRIYGKKFQEDQYERLLPTPYASGVQYNTDNSWSDPQHKQQNKPNTKYQPTYPQPQMRSNYEYYIIENEVSLLLKKRPCLDLHYKFNSIQHFSLRFYNISSMDLSQSQSYDTNTYMDREQDKLHEDEQRIFLKAIQNYQKKIFDK